MWSGVLDLTKVTTVWEITKSDSENCMKDKDSYVNLGFFDNKLKIMKPAPPVHLWQISGVFNSCPTYKEKKIMEAQIKEKNMKK